MLAECQRGDPGPHNVRSLRDASRSVNIDSALGDAPGRKEEPTMIWDLHCHLLGVPGVTPEQRMARLIAFADRLGIERLCVYMGMNWSYDPTPDELRKQNDEVLQALSHYHDRAFGFVYLNPRYEEASLKELDRCVKDGPMVGVKLWVA